MRQYSTRHRCAALTCNKLVPARYLMCAHHWALVPRDVQVAVYAAYTPGKRGRAWLAAVSAALSSVTVQGDLFAGGGAGELRP